MFRYALTSLRANLTRLGSTALAVVIGITFLSAGLLLTDAMRAGLTGDVEAQYEAVDLALLARSSEGGFGLLQTIPAETLDLVRSTDGVAAAAGEIIGDARVLRDDGSSVSLRSQGRAWIDDAVLNPLTLTEGSAPDASDDVVLDRRLAQDAGVSVGDTVALETPAGLRSATVSGISRFGDQDALDDGGTISFPGDTAVEVLNSGVPGFSDILVRTDEDPGVVADRLGSRVGGSVEIQTRAEFIETSTQNAAAFIDVLRPILSGFAYLAMFVAAFVIFNTFSVVVTQRLRELALIRAIGGTPSQVRRSLLVEGLGVGLGASVIGVLVGFGVTHLLFWVLGRFDLGLPSGRVSLSLGTVALSIAVGTVVTVLSVMVPAFRAGRTKPVEAMRSSAVDTSGTSTARAVIGGALLLGSLAFLGANQLLDPQWYLIAPGALLLFVGLFVGGPLLARMFALLTRPVLSLAGLTGRLAADNSVRNPKRTATTANALVIGLFLVTLVTVSGEAIKSAVVEQLNALSSSDFIISSERSIDPELVSAVAEVDGVSNTAAVRFGVTTLADGATPVFVTTANLDALADTAGTTVIAGSAAPVADGPGIAVADLTEFGGGGAGAQPILGLGDAITLLDAEGSELELRTEAILEGSLDSLFLGYLVGEETFEQLVGEQPVAIVFVRVEPGEADAVGRRLEVALDGFTGVEVQPGNFIGAAFATVFDFLIGAVNALLGMSVIVALVGIVNTMTLSIFERRSELGMVRALGMTRQQVGRMVRAEAVLIGLLGTVVGMAAGVLLSWVVVSSVGQGEIGLSFNWARVGLIFAVGVLVGLIASVLPSRRATRLDMLEAMRSE